MNETNEAELKCCFCGKKTDGKNWTKDENDKRVSCHEECYFSQPTMPAAWNTRHQRSGEKAPEKLWCAYCGVWGDHQSGWCFQGKVDQVEVLKAEIAALKESCEIYFSDDKRLVHKGDTLGSEFAKIKFSTVAMVNDYIAQNTSDIALDAGDKPYVCPPFPNILTLTEELQATFKNSLMVENERMRDGILPLQKLINRQSDEIAALKTALKLSESTESDWITTLTLKNEELKEKLRSKEEFRRGEQSKLCREIAALKEQKFDAQVAANDRWTSYQMELAKIQFKLEVAKETLSSISKYDCKCVLSHYGVGDYVCTACLTCEALSKMED